MSLSSSLCQLTVWKGIDVHGDDIHIFADLIEQRLGIPCSALSGANIANEVARDTFSETTIGYRNKEDGELWLKLFRKFLYIAAAIGMKDRRS